MEPQQTLDDIPDIESILSDLKKWIETVGEDHWLDRRDCKAMVSHDRRDTAMQAMAEKLIKHRKVLSLLFSSSYGG